MSPTGPNWRTTFNDMITLLMVFFVLLFSMSSMSKSQGMEFLNKLQSGLGIMKPGQKTWVGVVEAPDQELPLENEEELEVLMKATEMERTKEAMLGQIEAAFGGPGSPSGIEGTLTEEGIRVRIRGDFLFELGQAEIKENVKIELAKLSDFLATIPNEVVVEGHTDDIPIRSGRYPSNWELSVARAVNVLKFLVQSGVSPHRLCAVGYGELKPVVPNVSSENRAKNRRVEILILDKRRS